MIVWTPPRCAQLRFLYPRADKTKLLAAFPETTWNGIKDKARHLGVRRLRKDDRPGFSTPFAVLAKLRARRIALGMTQSDLAEKMGWSKIRVAMAERARPGKKGTPGFAMMMAWAEVLGCEIDIAIVAKPKTLRPGSMVDQSAQDMERFERIAARPPGITRATRRILLVNDEGREMEIRIATLAEFKAAVARIGVVPMRKVA